MFAYWLSPDVWMTATFAGITGVVVVCYIAGTGSLRRERRVVTAPGPRVGSTRPLCPGMLVEITAGPFAGLCGWVREIALITVPGDGLCRVKIQLNDGRFVWAEREDVAPLL